GTWTVLEAWHHRTQPSSDGRARRIIVQVRSEAGGTEVHRLSVTRPPFWLERVIDSLISQHARILVPSAMDLTPHGWKTIMRYGVDRPLPRRVRHGVPRAGSGS